MHTVAAWQSPNSLVVLPDACAPAEALQRFHHLHQHGTVQEGAVFKQPLHLQSVLVTKKYC